MTSRSRQPWGSRGRLVLYLRNRFATGDEAEDIVQEAYARLESHAGRDAIADEERFVWRTALNLATSWRRKHFVREVAHGDAAVVDFLHPSEPLPDEVVEVRERLRIVEHAISQLPERCRAVFIACRIEGLSYSQAAKEFGVSVSAIEKHMARAITHLTLKVQDFGKVQGFGQDR